MAEEDTRHNPLLAALPPATDYLTYLTIIEYNLTEENLSTLHQVLQDTELTVNIGWDLINLLLPLLPASEACLQTIAAKGNPREVILKVTEALRLLEIDEPLEQDSDEESAAASVSKTELVEAREPSISPALPAPVVPPLYVLKFEILLSLLSTLHQRVKTKYPSRFLSTSLQAVLAAYGKAQDHLDELTLSATKFVKNLSGTKRPHLPPRTASGNPLKTGAGFSEPDPEAQKEPPTPDEETLVNRLLQSFITHILEDYILSISYNHDVPGLAWSSRLMEKCEPKRTVLNKKTYAERFAQEEDLKARSAILGQIVALAQDLSLSTQDLFRTFMDPEVEKPGIPGEENEPPSSAEDISLSKTGSLFLFAARHIKQELFATTSPDASATISIFPDHAAILDNFVGTVGLQTVGLEPEALLDTILCLGLLAVEKNNVGEPVDDESFAKYLQTLSLVSANTPSPSLRYHAHYLTSTILRSHPSDLIRLTFIRDTLEHCPYENLKASAVGWLKGETLEANIPQNPTSSSLSTEESTSSIFATPVALSTTAPFLFPDLTSSWASAVEISENFMQFRTELGFYLAALNFYYLLLTAKFLHENLDIAGLHKSSSMEKTYLAPLRQAVSRFREALKDGGELAIAEGEEGVQNAQMDLMILEDVLDRVGKGAKGLGSADENRCKQQILTNTLYFLNSKDVMFRWFRRSSALAYVNSGVSFPIPFSFISNNDSQSLLPLPTMSLDVFLKKFDKHIETLRELSTFLDESLQSSLPGGAADVLIGLTGQVGKLNGWMVRAKFQLAEQRWDTEYTKPRNDERHGEGLPQTMKRKASSEVVKAEPKVLKVGKEGEEESQGKQSKRKADHEHIEPEAKGRRRRSITSGNELEEEEGSGGHAPGTGEPAPDSNAQDEKSEDRVDEDDYEVQYVDISGIVLQQLREGPGGHLWGGPITGKRKRDDFLEDNMSYDSVADTGASAMPSSAPGSRLGSPTKKMRILGQFEQQNKRKETTRESKEDGEADPRKKVKTVWQLWTWTCNEYINFIRKVLPSTAQIRWGQDLPMLVPSWNFLRVSNFHHFYFLALNLQHPLN
ncbi:DUF1760-domain-containing protein [Lindgomyces ingoldianus]|uniref:DUF1760-domain-containing protein n=1 Tax=Lindgomyces ingoldianus TaxID=673940 RepID=A0ACB6QSS8_9PLEO|nr:DUF1760-domain-containing protein [Lindgomyces ingoldianus]KAF2470064.1 DUF1760-domain-containing protein [Lindgomyces ingoldianus]